MTKIDREELEILRSFEKGKLKSVATKAELAKLKAAAQRSRRSPRKRAGA